MCHALHLLFQMSLVISLPNGQGEIAGRFGQVGLIVLLFSSEQTIWQDTNLLVNMARDHLSLGVSIAAAIPVQSSHCCTTTMSL